MNQTNDRQFTATARIIQVISINNFLQIIPDILKVFFGPSLIFEKYFRKLNSFIFFKKNLDSRHADMERGEIGFSRPKTWLNQAKDGLKSLAIKIGVNNQPTVESQMEPSVLQNDDIDPELTGDILSEQLTFEFPRPWGIQAEIRRYEDFRVTTPVDWLNCKFIDYQNYFFLKIFLIIF